MLKVSNFKRRFRKYAEILRNLQNKLNIPLDDLMKNIQSMVGPMMGQIIILKILFKFN